MNIFDLVAKITLDLTQYKAGVKEAQADQTRLARDMQTVQGRTESLQNRMNALSKQYSSAMTNVRRLTDEYNKSEKETGDTSEETRKLARELETAEDRVEKISRKLDDYSDALRQSEGQTEKSTGGLATNFLNFSSKASMVVTAISTTINTVWNLAEAALSAIGALVRGATTAFTTLARFGLTYNMEIEAYTTNFKVMLGDAEAAAQKVEELREMAAATPFGLSDLADATQMLLAFGVESENTIDILQRLGDIASGDAQKLYSLVLAYSQATSLGRLQGQDWRQMVGVGFNPLEPLSQYAGLTVGQLQEIMSGASKETLQAMRNMQGVTEYGKQLIDQGYISASDLQLALELATEEGGQFFNGMAEASKTVSGQISTLKDDLSTMIGGFFEPVSVLLRDTILPNAIKLVDAISKMANPETAEEGRAAFSELLGGIVDSVAVFVGDNSEAFAAAGVTMLLALIDGAAENIGPLTSALFTVIGAVLAELTNRSPELAESGGNLIAALFDTWILEYGTKIRPRLAELFIAIARDAPYFLGALLDNFRLTEIADVLGKTFFEDDVLGSLKFGFAAKDSTEKMWDSARGYVKNEVFGSIGSFFGSVKEGWDSFFGGVDNVAERARTSGIGETNTRAITGGANIERVDLQVNIGGTNASTDEIRDAMIEGLSVGLYEFSQRKAAAYGR